MKWLKRIALFLAIATLAGTVVNASWLAPDPAGGVKLIAHRGIQQNYIVAGAQPDACTAALIEQPVHDYIGNTARSMRKAQQMGAQMVEMDIVLTSDGQIAIFQDGSLDCRTNASGDTGDFSMEELQAVNIAHFYSADGGETFPLRAKGAGQMPSLEQALAVLPRTPIMFNLGSATAAEADLLASRLDAAGRDVEEVGDAFYGDAAAIARIAQHYPDAWSFSADSARACSEAYVLRGWTGILPSVCEGGTMIVPLNSQWTFWGWPNRLMARMDEAGGHVLVLAPDGEGDTLTGLILPEQLTEIPASYSGYVWVEDMWTLGPALRPSQDRRSNLEAVAAQEGLDRRRARLNAQ